MSVSVCVRVFVCECALCRSVSELSGGLSDGFKVMGVGGRGVIWRRLGPPQQGAGVKAGVR